MTYSVATTIGFGSAYPALTLQAQIKDSAGVNVGSAITTGFVNLADGDYGWRYDNLADGFIGYIVFSATAGGSPVPLKMAVTPADASAIVATPPTPGTPGQFCTTQDLEDALGRPVTRAASATRAIERATAMIQSYTYQTIAYVADDVITLNPVGNTSILLPEVPVVAVSSVVEAGVTLVLTDDYTWDADGILRRRWPQQSSRVWPLTGVRNFPNEPNALVVTYSHGYQTIPADIREVCLSMAVRSYQATERAAMQYPGVQAETLPDHSVQWMPESRRGDASLGWSAAPFLLPSEEEILSSYRMRP